MAHFRDPSLGRLRPGIPVPALVKYRYSTPHRLPLRDAAVGQSLAVPGSISGLQSPGPKVGPSWAAWPLAQSLHRRCRPPVSLPLFHWAQHEPTPRDLDSLLVFLFAAPLTDESGADNVITDAGYHWGAGSSRSEGCPAGSLSLVGGSRMGMAMDLSKDSTQPSPALPPFLLSTRNYCHSL